MWEVAHEDTADASPRDVWRLWSDPGRWPDWNSDIEQAWLEGPLALGSVARIKFQRGPALRFEITALEPERLFTDETRLPLGRLGHEHRVEPAGGRVRIRNRLYFHGPAGRRYGLLMGRRMRAAVRRFVQLEKRLAEEGALASQVHP